MKRCSLCSPTNQLCLHYYTPKKNGNSTRYPSKPSQALTKTYIPYSKTPKTYEHLGTNSIRT